MNQELHFYQDLDLPEIVAQERIQSWFLPTSRLMGNDGLKVSRDPRRVFRLYCRQYGSFSPLFPYSR
jgi:hypothetical protein